MTGKNAFGHRLSVKVTDDSSSNAEDSGDFFLARVRLCSQVSDDRKDLLLDTYMY